MDLLSLRAAGKTHQAGSTYPACRGFTLADASHPGFFHRSVSVSLRRLSRQTGELNGSLVRV